MTLEDECEWHLGEYSEFFLVHKPTRAAISFKSYVMKNVALGMMANLLKKTYC